VTPCLTARHCYIVGLAAVLGALHLLPAASARTTSAATHATSRTQSEYDRALQLGIKAYVYGIPLLDTNRVFLTSTSVNVPDGAGGGPVNQFSNVRRLAKPSDKTVVAPNHDTLYSMAWLNLARQPIVAHVPADHAPVQARERRGNPQRAKLAAAHGPAVPDRQSHRRRRALRRLRDSASALI
jgi:hypothetical protein